MPDIVKPHKIGSVARWLMPSLRSYSALVILVLLVRNSWRFLSDGDTGWHIRTGEWILENGTVPRHDLFSYTMPGREWFAWEWLSDILLAIAHQRGGLALVVASAMCVLLASFIGLYLLTIRRGSDPLLALILTSLAAVSTLVHWQARPHVVSFLLIVIWSGLIETYRRTRGWQIYVIPPLVLLWANLHGSFVITLPILVVYAVGEFIEFAVRGKVRSPELRAVMRTYTLVGVGSLVAALLTPYGIALYHHLWRYLGDQSLLAAINEFKSPNFHLTDGKVIEVLLLLGGIAAGLALRRGRVVESGLFILLAHMTLQSQRHVALAAVLLTPFIAAELTELSREVSQALSSREGKIGRRWSAIAAKYSRYVTIDGQLPGYVYYVALFAFLIVVARGPAAERFLSPHFDSKVFPVAAAEYIAANTPSGNLFAYDGFGGYLIYRLHPKVKVFVDGRSDFYRGGGILDEMSALVAPRASWKEILDRHRVMWMLLRKDEPLALLAAASGQWVSTYEDETAQIFVRVSE